MTDDELRAAKEDIHDLFEKVRADLAEDLGGEPEDYRVDESPVPDGGDN